MMTPEQKEKATIICFEIISLSQANIADMKQKQNQSLFDDLIKEEETHIAYFLDLVDWINGEND